MDKRTDCCHISCGMLTEKEVAELLLNACTDYTRGLYESCGGVKGTRWMMIVVTAPEILEDAKDLISIRMKRGR